MGSLRERYPYGYSGELSGECEIPLAVLQELYADDDNDGEVEEDYGMCDIAMVAETQLETEECCDPTIAAPIGEADVVPEQAHKKRRIEIDPVELEDRIAKEDFSEAPPRVQVDMSLPDIRMDSIATFWNQHKCPLSLGLGFSEP